jgi:CubicO group peptidase (beta-lactamase class C family)
MRILCLLLAVTTVAGASTLPSKKDLVALAAAWDAAAQSTGLPGYSAAIVTPHGILYQHSYGTRDCGRTEPANAQTMYYIASATKPLVAAAVLQLAGAGRIKLDAPVKSYLPRFALADEHESATITVRDLLTHGRGLNEFVITFGEAFTGEMDDDKFYRLLATVKARGRFSYSNLHYTLLGRIIESVTGISWKQYLATRLFAPLDMKRTTTSASEWLADPNHACPLEYWDGAFQPSPLVKSDRTMHAAGGIASTATDLARFLHMEMNDGSFHHQQVIAKALMQQSHQLQAATDAKYFAYHRSGYGYGWYIGEYRGHMLVHHFGGFEGAHAHLSWLPEQKIGIVVLQNSDGATVNFSDAVADSLYDAVLALDSTVGWRDYETHVADEKRKATSEPPLKVAQLPMPMEELAGSYANSDWGTLVFTRHGDEVSACIGDYPLRFSRDAAGVPVANIEGRAFQIVFTNTEGIISRVELKDRGLSIIFERPSNAPPARQ